MPTPTYLPIAQTTLGSSSATVTFSSIPTDGSFRDLVLVMTLATSGSSNNLIRFNGSTSGYTRAVMSVNGSGTITQQASADTGIQIDREAFSNTINSDTVYLLNIMEYSATDKYKIVTFEAAAEASKIDIGVGRWTGTTAVNSITIASNSGRTFSAGSFFRLFGIAS